MIERAIEGNSSAIFLLGAHYASSQNLAMADFYNYSFADKEYALSDKHYAIIYKYAQEGNATAKNMIEEQEEIMKRKKKLLSHKDFIKECQMDDFCVRSDIYREYSSKQINETK
jgi:hypothetical protein